MKTEQEFKQLVRKKIDGYYTTEGYYARVIERIARVREEIIGLLKSVTKVDTSNLLEYMDSSGFFYRPSSGNRHHNTPGGLAKHSIGTFWIVEEWNNMTPEERRNSELFRFKLAKRQDKIFCDIFTEKMDHDDMVIATICHDLCKARHYYFDGHNIKAHHRSDKLDGHSSVSVARLKNHGINTKECEELLLAVGMHMSLYPEDEPTSPSWRQKKGRRSMLAIAVWAADKMDAKRFWNEKAEHSATSSKRFNNQK